MYDVSNSFCWDFIKYTVLYSVHIRSWPTRLKHTCFVVHVIVTTRALLACPCHDYTHYTHYTHDLHYSHYPHACLLTLQNTERWAHVVVLQQLCQQHAQSFTYAHTHASYLCIYETGMCGGAVSAVCTTLTPVLTRMHPTSISMKQACVEELCQQYAQPSHLCSHTCIPPLYL